MNHIIPYPPAISALAACLLASPGSAAEEVRPPTPFQHHVEVGRPSRAGTYHYDARTGAHSVAGGGANMWFDRDDFHFAWTRVSGDVGLTADIRWARPGGNAHRKACLILRQDLDPDSAYVDAVLHGDGLTSLQFREEKGGPTSEIQANVTAPTILRLERCGDFFWMSWGRTNSPLQPAGGSVRIAFKDPLYLGLGVCAHDDATLEEAIFSQVRLDSRTHRTSSSPSVVSTLEVIPIDSRDRRAIYTTPEHIEAPNWSPDGGFFLFNRQGRICRIPVGGGAALVIDTGSAVRCNNDHGISPDGTQLVISDQTETGQSLIYILPITGGPPRKVTSLGPSYWHGWSPDGKTLAYCAERNGEYDVYTIPATGGPETRLTTAPGLDDGPEYSPDGRWIYFNSDRTGRMHIWRMLPDGTGQEQLTHDDYNNWFPHPSPDGRWIAFLSYEKDVAGHPANKDVRLRLMPAGGGTIQILTRLFGGQGTINVPSWSPDGKRLAFVSYRLVHH